MYPDINNCTSGLYTDTSNNTQPSISHTFEKKRIYPILDNEKIKKKKIPQALREEVWKTYNKDKFVVKCPISWCTNEISAFNFHVGHNIPESKGGTLDISNLLPICSKCNLSMSNNYTIDEWKKIGKPKTKKFYCVIS
jgi:5-methylcytosine-specific restriction endonuclease McrA